MPSTRPVITKINIVARRYQETLAFYRLLGVDLPEPMQMPPGTLHTETTDTSGAEFALDNETLARLYNAGWRNDGDCSSIVITARVPSRQDVDATYQTLVEAGFRGRQLPYDAFWGARFAIVCDPEGNDVGLMSPVDESLRSWPPSDSPAIDTA